MDQENKKFFIFLSAKVKEKMSEANICSKSNISLQGPEKQPDGFGLFYSQDAMFEAFKTIPEDARQEYTILACDKNINGAKYYGFSKTEYLEKRIMSYPEHERTFYEIETNPQDNLWTKKTWRKLKFDWDLSPDKTTDEETGAIKDEDKNLFNFINKNPDSLIVARNFLEERIRDVFNKIYQKDIAWTNIIIHDSSTDKKKSFHFVINGFVVSDSDQAKAFYNEVTRGLEKDILFESRVLKCLDPAPYNNNRCWRIMGCAKFGAGYLRAKRLVGSKNHLSFVNSLTTHSDGCEKLPDIAKAKSAFRTGEAVILKDPDLIDELAEEFRGRIVSDNGTLVYLMNLDNPRVCKIGGEYNFTDNAYFIKHSDRIVYHCYDSDCKREHPEGIVACYLDENQEKTDDPSQQPRKRLLKRKIPICPEVKIEEVKEACSESKNEIEPVIEPIVTSTNAKNINPYKQDQIQKFIKQGIESLTHFNKQNSDHSDEYVQSFPREQRVLGIVANCGMGKTEEMCKDIIHFSEKRLSILVVSSRISYSHSIQERIYRSTGMRFDNYQNLKGNITSRYVICQAESLHRLCMPYDVVYLDESESILTQLVSKGTNKKWFLENNQMFEKLVLRAIRVVFMDAFMSNRTTNYFNDIKVPYVIQNYTKERAPRQAINFPYLAIKGKCHKYLGKFVEFLIYQIIQGKKIFFVSESMKKQEAIIEKIKEKYPSVRVLVYNSRNRLAQGIDVNDEWIGYQVVSITTTITVGVNFNVENYFDFSAVYLSTMSKVLVRDTFQALNRVRYLKEEKVYWIHNCWNMKKENCSAVQINNDFIDREQLHYETISRLLGTDEDIKVMSEPTKNLFLWDKRERNISIMNKRELWEYYLKKDNYSLEIIPEEKDEEGDEHITIITPKEDDWDWDCVGEITQDIKAKLLIKKRTQPLSEEELIKIVKYDYQTYLIKNDEGCAEEHWEKYQKHTDVFWDLSLEKGYDPTNPFVFAQKDQEQIAEFSRMRVCKCEKIDFIKKFLNIKFTRDFETIIQRDVIERLGAEMNKNKDEWTACFRVRGTRAEGKIDPFKRGLEFINQILLKTSGVTLKATTSRAKEFSISDYLKLGYDLWGNLQATTFSGHHDRLLPKRSN